MTQTIHGLLYIKSKCIRQTAQREAPYDVWILVTEEGSIETAGCQCIGDDGGCKHVVALLLSVANFKSSINTQEQVQDQKTCTDILCTWNKPRKCNKSKRVIDIERRRDTSNPRPCDPHPTFYNPCDLKEGSGDRIRAAALRMVAGTQAGIIQVLQPASQIRCHNIEL
ncbi:hypothetical protein Pcinc_032202 [Petrolisthes cinctipes]|uniref:SWIM-type domain-containing protein n=2 Tax=Petrolisthes cinctipes TaxID=88211 RepID=A0AAE1EV30_PETCI|nr:hypothetical protein Pcinc_032202 [Petrolisthes cinctipes]